MHKCQFRDIVLKLKFKVFFCVSFFPCVSKFKDRSLNLASFFSQAKQKPDVFSTFLKSKSQNFAAQQVSKEQFYLRGEFKHFYFASKKWEDQKIDFHKGSLSRSTLRAALIAVHRWFQHWPKSFQ